MNRRPALIPVFHRVWLMLASAMLLAGCTVVPEPTTYTYRQTPCPPGVGAGTTIPAPQAQSAQPPAEAPPPVAQAPDAPQAQTAPPQAQAQSGPAATCYTAVPGNYTYSYYPGYTYPYPYPYAYPYYPAYYPYYYGPTVGFVDFDFARRHHFH